MYDIDVVNFILNIKYLLILLLVVLIGGAVSMIINFIFSDF
jgi:hypothetical protein